MMKDSVWIEDISVLFNDLRSFVPSRKMTLNEKFNAVIRLSIYVSVIHYVILGEARIFGLPIITMLLSYVYYRTLKESYANHNHSMSKQLNHKQLKPKVDSHKCTKPQNENPFMNVMINEYAENPERGSACNVDDSNVKKSMHDKYFRDAYRDIDDAFDRKSSFRNFYTMPNTTIPNDQNEFAQWLYGVKEKTQKEGNGNRNKNFASYY